MSTFGRLVVAGNCCICGAAGGEAQYSDQVCDSKKLFTIASALGTWLSVEGE